MRTRSSPPRSIPCRFSTKTYPSPDTISGSTSLSHQTRSSAAGGPTDRRGSSPRTSTPRWPLPSRYWRDECDCQRRCAGTKPVVQIILALALPRDEQTIPVSRHIAVNAMNEIGVTEDCMQDIAVALTEACTNVLRHSGPGDEYEVSLEVDEDQCVIRVVDTGRGFDSTSLGFEHADTSAE